MNIRLSEILCIKNKLLQYSETHIVMASCIFLIVCLLNSVQTYLLQAGGNGDDITLLVALIMCNFQTITCLVISVKYPCNQDHRVKKLS